MGHLGLRCPLPLNILAMSRMLLPDSAILNMRCPTAAAPSSIYSLGRIFAPSCTCTFL